MESLERFCCGGTDDNCDAGAEASKYLLFHLSRASVDLHRNCNDVYHSDDVGNGDGGLGRYGGSDIQKK